MVLSGVPKKTSEASRALLAKGRASEKKSWVPVEEGHETLTLFALKSYTVSPSTVNVRPLVE